MDNSEKILSNILHQKLDEITIDSNFHKGYDVLQMKMSMKKFFHFHPRHFNIYYASAIFCSVIFNVVLGIQYFRNQKAIDQKMLAMEVKSHDQQRTFQQLSQNKVLITKPTLNKEGELLTKKFTPSKMDSFGTNKKVAGEKTKIEKPYKAALPKADTTLLNATTPHVNHTLQAPTKTLYIVKQDTIIQYDSIPLLPRKTKARRK